MTHEYATLTIQVTVPSDLRHDAGVKADITRAAQAYAAETYGRDGGEPCGRCGFAVELNGRTGFYEATAPVVETDHRRLCHGRLGLMHYPARLGSDPWH